MGFYRQEYWSGLSFSLLGDLPDDSGIELCLLHWQENSLPLNQLESLGGILDDVIPLFPPLLIKTKVSISKALLFYNMYF